MYFFGTQVKEGAMLAVLGGSAILLIAVYVVMNMIAKRR